MEGKAVSGRWLFLSLTPVLAVFGPDVSQSPQASDQVVELVLGEGPGEGGGIKADAEDLPLLSTVECLRAGGVVLSSLDF